MEYEEEEEEGACSSILHTFDICEVWGVHTLPFTSQ